MAMTIQELQQSEKVYVNAEDVAGLLNVNPHYIRLQAHADKTKLGFPVIVTGRRVRIPRVPLLQMLGYAATEGGVAV